MTPDLWVTSWSEPSWRGRPAHTRATYHDTERAAEAEARRVVATGVREVVVYARPMPVSVEGAS